MVRAAFGESSGANAKIKHLPRKGSGEARMPEMRVVQAEEEEVDRRDRKGATPAN